MLSDSGPIDLIDQLMQSNRIDSLLIPCKAGGLGWPAAKAVIRLTPAQGATSEPAFEIAKKLFELYVARFATLDRLISNANAVALLLFVLWVYYTMCVFLVGGEVARTADLVRREREQH